MVQGAFIGAFSAGVYSGVSGSVGAALGSTTAGCAAGGAAAGMFAGGVGAALGGGNVWQGMLKGGLIGGVIGGIMGAINGASKSPGNGTDMQNTNHGTANSSAQNQQQVRQACVVDQPKWGSKWAMEHSYQVADVKLTGIELFEKFVNSPYRDVIIDEIVTQNGQPGYTDVIISGVEKVNESLWRFGSDTAQAFKTLYNIYLEGVNNNMGLPTDQLKCVQGCH